MELLETHYKQYRLQGYILIKQIMKYTIVYMTCLCL